MNTVICSRVTHRRSLVAKSSYFLGGSLRSPAARRRGHAVGHAPGGDEETGVPDHPVIGPDSQSFDMPVANQGLPRVRLGETPVIANGLDRFGQLRGGGDVTADHAAR